MLELEGSREARCEVGKTKNKEAPLNMSRNLCGWTGTHVGLSSSPDHMGLLWRPAEGKLVPFVKKLNMRVVQELRKLQESLREGRADGNLAAAPQTQRQVANWHSALVLGSTCAPSPMLADIEMTWLPLSLPSESHTEHLLCPIQLETHSRGDSGRGHAG